MVYISKVLITDTYLSDIADAIRYKLSTSSSYKPSEMSGAIREIRTTDISVTNKNITANGTYQASADSVDGYSRVIVNVPNSYTNTDEGKVVSGGALVAQTTKAITSNGTHSTVTNNSVTVNVPNSFDSSDEGKVVSNGSLVAQTTRSITANGAYDTMTNNVVAVNVPNTFSGADEGKVVESGALVSQTSTSVSANGTYNTTKNSSIVVAIPTFSGSYTVTPTQSSQTIATAGKVMTDNLTVQGYTAPDIGTKTITANNTYYATDDSLDGYSSVVVRVPNSYTSEDEGKVVYSGALTSQTSRNIDTNGTYSTVTNSSVVVNVPQQSYTLVSKSVTANGSYDPTDDSADGYNSLTVNVPNTYTSSDENKVVSSGALVAQTSQTVTTNGTYDTTTNDEVVVAIPTFSGSYTVTPTQSSQTIATAGKVMTSDLTVSAATGTDAYVANNIIILSSSSVNNNVLEV